jgi:hypothetical protein
MSLPISPNTTCDIYRSGITPPTSPAVAAVPCFLQADWRGGNEAGDRAVNTLAWTHFMLVDVSVDIRDAYTGHMTSTLQDTIYVPDQTGTAFNVMFVERLQRGTPQEHKRVFLDRQTPSWPTNEL